MDNIKVVISGSGNNLRRNAQGGLYPGVIAKVEKSLIERALREAEGNQSRAAKKLGINRNTLHVKIKKFNIDVGRYKI